MSDLWEDDGFGSASGPEDAGSDDDWDEGEESIETALEDGFDDPDELDDLEDDALADEGDAL